MLAEPLKVEVGDVLSTNEPPLPEIILHPPVPTDGVLPANEVEVRPHITELIWSVPAFAVVGRDLLLI